MGLPPLLGSLLPLSFRCTWPLICPFDALFGSVEMFDWDCELEGVSVDPARDSPNVRGCGVCHRGRVQARPVKDLMLMLAFCHLRHGFVVRSSDRSFSLMAPWLALGPRRVAAVAVAVALAGFVPLARGSVLHSVFFFDTSRKDLHFETLAGCHFGLGVTVLQLPRRRRHAIRWSTKLIVGADRG